MNALKGLDGISKSDVTIGQAVVEHEGALDVEAVKHAIEEEGYKVVAVS